MKNNLGFKCFSPPVMLATFITEIAMAIYVVWRHKLGMLQRLVLVTLVALAAFQLSEYFVCTSFGLRAEQWSRAGFVIITLLPPLGLHILHVLAGKSKRWAVNLAYASMAAFVVIFLTYHSAFIGHECTGNYVIFQLGERLGGLYGLYYYGWLLAAMALGVRWANEIKEQGKKTRQKLRTVQALIIGYLIFLVPTALANTVRPESRRGIPSIMCGFAVLFAFILVFYILPKAKSAKSRG